MCRANSILASGVGTNRLLAVLRTVSLIVAVLPVLVSAGCKAPNRYDPERDPPIVRQEPGAPRPDAGSGSDRATTTLDANPDAERPVAAPPDASVPPTDTAGDRVGSPPLVDGAPTGPTGQIAVLVAGGGAGQVTSTPPGIQCPMDCQASFPAGTDVEIAVLAGQGSTFGGWSDGVAGGPRTVRVMPGGSTSLTARFLGGPGTHVWHTPAAPESRAVGVDGQGRITVLAASTRNMTFNLGQGSVSGQAFLVRHHADGKLDGVTLVVPGTFGGTYNHTRGSFAVARGGDVAITLGIHGEAVSIAGVSMVPPAAILLVYRADGTVRWTRTHPNPQQGYGPEVAFDDGGNLHWYGRFSGTVDLGQGPMTAQGDQDHFVAKYDGAGASTWVRRYGSQTGRELAGGNMTVTGTGDVMITGASDGSLDLGGPLEAPPPGNEHYFAKLDRNGNKVWVHFTGSRDNIGFLRLQADPGGNLLGVGSANENIVLAGVSVAATPATPIWFVVKHAGSDGRALWERHHPLAGATQMGSYGYDLAIDAGGNVILTGQSRTADFGAGVQGGAGADLFLLKRSPAGDVIWDRRHGAGARTASGHSLTFAQDRVYLTGEFWGRPVLGQDATLPMGSASSPTFLLLQFLP
jgi:hypothetical protein